MVESNEETSLRTRKDGSTGSSHNSRSESGTGSVGEQPGNFDSRTLGAVGTEAIVGGMLSQMIEEVESQLQNDQECIEWYEREKEKHLRKLENLRQLRELQLSSEPGLDPQDEEV